MVEMIYWSFTYTLYFSKVKKQVLLAWICYAIKLHKMQTGG